MVRNIFQTLRQLYESFRFAMQSIMINKMRTFLSLLGITIGIFAIISVYTAIDSMESYIRKNFDAFGSNTVYVDKWPWIPEGDGEYQWWKYMNRPAPTITEYTELTEKLKKQIEASSLNMSFNRMVKYDKASRASTSIVGVSYEYDKLSSMEIATGRYFTPFESNSGQPVALIGATIAEDVFGDVDPVGKQMKIGGRTVNIIGKLKKEGDNMFGFSSDAMVILPLHFSKTMANIRWANPQMMIKCKTDVDFEDFKGELENSYRAIRRLSPEAENTFSLNEIDAISGVLDGIFSTINLVGGIIGLFSILVGGFGVANIMFVSVKERTSQIGIQKALGAKPYSILSMFLIEAVLLSIVGGAVGLLMIWLVATIASAVTDYEIVLTFGNIMIGLCISSAVGAISGFFPAWSAAKMQPVKAIYKT